MFEGCSSFDVEQPYQPTPLVNNPSSTWLHTPPVQMPWGLPVADQPSVMRFTGDSLAAPIVPVMETKIQQFENLSKPQSKRKSWECEIEYNALPVKQLITEDKMAENLNCMHISNSYVSHQIGSSQPMSIPLPESTSHPSAETADLSLSESSESSSSAIDVSLEGKDRTVSLCEQLRKLISESSVIPSPLLNKVERPSNALVLWQPPGGSIFKNITKSTTTEEDGNQPQEVETKASTSGINFSTRSSSQSSWSDLMDNNNSSNAMDLNLLPTGSSLRSSLLPSEVPLPDDDAMDSLEDSLMDF